MKSASVFNRWTGMLPLCLMAVLSGACRKDLCYNHFRQAKIDINWEYAWERDYGCGWPAVWDESKYGMAYNSLFSGKPEGVTVLIYDESNNISRRFLSPEGGETVLSEGIHSFLLYNNDTEYIVFNDTASSSRPEDAKATTTTRTRSTLRALHADERTVSPPDVLYGAFCGNVAGVGLHESVGLQVVMRPLVYTYIVRYEFAEGLKHVALARGALAGMAEAVYLRDGKTSDETVTILFDCELTSWGVQATVKSFGVPGFPDKYYPKAMNSEEGNKRSYVLNLEVLLGNEKLKTFDFNVTTQMQQQPCGGVITVKDIIISENESGADSGFKVNVEGWGENEDVIELPFGL